MDESQKPSGMDQLHQLLLTFQCQRVPFDLISRASEPKLSWSATGEIEQIQPYEGGVPRWLLDLREAHQWPFDHDEGATSPEHDDLHLANDCGVWYFEVQPTDGLEADENEQSQEAYASQCIRIFNHAFPCRNTEVLGEEIVARLMPLAKAFLLPLLASVSENDIQDWLLPKERAVPFAVSLFDCLLQILTHLGPRSPLYPASFPRKMVNAIDIPTTQGSAVQDRGVGPCLTVVLELIEVISSSSLGAFERLASNIACGDLDERSNAWAGLALVVLLSSQAATRLQPKALSDAITKAAGSWYPKSTTSPSPMEYLVAIELLPHAQLRTISLPESLRVNVELNILRGLLLSRMQYYDEASRVLYDAMPAAISDWGIASFQVGLVAAESANCYNMLRKEGVANTIATRCLAARSTPELIARQDWFYLSLYLVDSLIGVGKYTEAESALEHLISQRPITPTIHMMGCLRLSKIRRRVSAEGGTIEYYHSLREGLSLFCQAPSALREEYLEEAACSLSTVVTTTQGSLEAQETLIDDINALIGQAGLRESPAQKRYAQAQLEFKQHILRQENSIVLGLDMPRADSITLADDPVGLIIDDTTTYIATQELFSVPYEADDLFIQRPEAEKKINLLSRDNDHYMHVYSIHGEAGIGKTVFVTDLVYTLRFHFAVVIWIKDGPLDEICDNLRRCAIQLQLRRDGSSTPICQDQPLEQLFKWFQNPKATTTYGRWLIVFDGIESEQVLDQIWPHGGRLGNVIVITRKVPSLPTMSNITSIKLEQLDLTKATELAFHYLPGSEILRRTSEILPRTYKTKDLHSLVNLLDCHPAAIKAAASLISPKRMPIQNFTSKFKQAQASYLSLPAMNEIRRQPNHSLPLITIWLIQSYESDQLMNVISLLSGLEIEENFLWPNGLIKISNYPQTAGDFEMMRNELLESTLIWRSRRHTLCTSTTVQAILRECMNTKSLSDARCGAFLLLHRSWPCKFEDLLWTDYSLSTQMKCSDLWPHVFSLAELITHFSITIPNFAVVEILEAILNISCCGIIRGDYHNANLFLILADDILDERIPAQDVPDRFSLRFTRQRCLLSHHRGRLASRQMLHQEARAHFRRSFVIAVQGLEPGSEDYWFIQATAHQGLGDVHRKTDSFEAAIASYEMSIKALIHVEEKYRQHLSAVRVSLGLSLLLNEQPEAAESVLEQVRPPSCATGVDDEISSPSRNSALFLGLAIAKLVQNKAEESFQLALECLSNNAPSFSQESYAEGLFHLVASISYGRLSKFGPALEHLDRARMAFGSNINYYAELSTLEEQRCAYNLMRQGTWGSGELEASWDLGQFFDEDGFLSMHYFITHFKNYILWFM